MKAFLVCGRIFHHLQAVSGTSLVWPASSTSLYLCYYYGVSSWPKLISSNKLPFYHKLLQKIAVLENEIQRLEVNVEINERYGNDSTLPWIQNGGQQQDANTQLTNANKAPDQCESPLVQPLHAPTGPDIS